MTRLALSFVLLLAACGVDGPPVPPSQAPEPDRGPSVTVSGSVGIGIAGRS